MKRFKNISLICKCDQPTLESAAKLALDNRARLTIVYPVGEVPAGTSQPGEGDPPVDIPEMVREEFQSHLEDVAESVRALGVSPETRLLAGKPFIEVIRDVVDNQRDLVIMTAEGQVGLKQRLFGTLSRHLMRKCPAPVFIMKPGHGSRFQEVLAAVDPLANDECRDTLDGLILELAKSLSAHDEATLHIAHAWTLFGEAVMRGRGASLTTSVDEEVDKEANRRRRAIDELLKKHAITDYELHLLKGEAADVIPQMINQSDIDLLVMGSICRTGIPGFFIGNTAESILDMVGCSVLVVKPEGFVSPVTAQITSGAPS